jgi:DNA helicase IV
LDFASRLLPVAAPGIQPTSSIRPGRTDPTLRRVRENELAATAMEEATALAEHHALVAVIVPEDLVPEVIRLARRNTAVGVLERDAMTRPVTIVPAPAAKGLEFDAVVVVEPAAIAGDDRRGLRLLYVAMTRPIQHLSVVHAQPLPSPLLG